MNYYIADLHFGHHNIIPMASRPFQCVQDMEKTLIENWNRKVKENDYIYIIGDLFYQHDHIDTILSRLKGKKHLPLRINQKERLESSGQRRIYNSIC